MEKSVFAISAIELRDWVLSLGDQKPFVLVTREKKDDEERIYMIGTSNSGNFDLKESPLVLKKLGDKSGNE